MRLRKAKVREVSMWSVLVFLAGVIFLMKGSRDMTKEAQARKRQMRSAARRNAELRKREQMQAMRRNAAFMERERQARYSRQNNMGYGYDAPYGAKNGYASPSVMGYGYAPNRKPIRRNTQERSAVRRAPQPVLTA